MTKLDVDHRSLGLGGGGLAGGAQGLGESPRFLFGSGRSLSGGCCGFGGFLDELSLNSFMILTSCITYTYIDH